MSTSPRNYRPAPSNRQRRVPLPLLGAMGSLMVVFLIAAVITGEWGFLIIGVIGFVIGLVPILTNR